MSNVRQGIGCLDCHVYRSSYRLDLAVGCNNSVTCLPQAFFIASYVFDIFCIHLVLME
jgi:hypothetical protein